jgi:hypothetical protein
VKVLHAILTSEDVQAGCSDGQDGNPRSHWKEAYIHVVLEISWFLDLEQETKNAVFSVVFY